MQKLTEVQISNLEKWANSPFGIEWIAELLKQNNLRGDVFSTEYMLLLNSHKIIQKQNKKLREALKKIRNITPATECYYEIIDSALQLENQEMEDKGRKMMLVCIKCWHIQPGWSRRDGDVCEKCKGYVNPVGWWDDWMPRIEEQWKEFCRLNFP